VVPEGEKTTRAETAQSYWRKNNKEKIVEKIREMSGMQDVKAGETRYLAWYQKAQCELWQELPEEEKKEWAESALKDKEPEMTCAEKTK
jgi:ABC-type molybdate transport system substrate-binding protein